MPAVRPVAFFMFLNAHELLEAVASGYGCKDDFGVESRPTGFKW